MNIRKTHHRPVAVDKMVVLQEANLLFYSMF